MNAEPILILGGTAEAAALARRLDGDARFAPITSLAGRTRDPAPLCGEVRSGGFGGAAGLADFLVSENIARLVDATHPYAATISRHAGIAATTAGIPLLRLERPPWRKRDGDRWVGVEHAAGAATALAELGRRIFLSVGRQELAAFRDLADRWFLVRTIDPPAAPVPLAHYEIVLGRGPFAAEDEVLLFRHHRLDAVVSRNSGSDATYGKIAAARRLGLPVVMIARPPSAQAGDTVGTVEDVLAWLLGAG